MKACLSSIVLIYLLSTSPILAQYSGGDGSKENPWKISEPNDLIGFGVNTIHYNHHFILTTDIDFSGKTFTTAIIAPLKISLFLILKPGKITPFNGSFDGNGHSISNLTFNTRGKGNEYVGLFGKLSANAVVQNLNIKNINITLINKSRPRGLAYFGGLTGFNQGTINNCTVTGSIQGDLVLYRLGGLVGWNEGNITNCHTAVSIKSYQCAGGLVGVNSHGNISKCYTTGSVTGRNLSDSLGGLVGANGSGIIDNCHATGSVTGGEDSHWLGGLVGINDQGKINNSYATGNISGYHRIGGLVGFNIGQITCSYSAGTITGNVSLGGLVGASGSNATPYRPVIDCFIKNCYTTSPVNGGDKSAVLGGLVGSCVKDIITNCYSTGTVTGGKESWKLGGLVGENDEGSISKCYSISLITGGEGSYYHGGLVGRNFHIINNCFWDIETCGIDAGVGKDRDGKVENLLGLTTSQLKTLSPYINAGWDFINETTNGKENIWRMPEQSDYPILNWQKIDKFIQQQN